MRRIFEVFRHFKSAFQSSGGDGPIRSHEEVSEEVARGIVGRSATGSVRLQRGQYVTREGMDQELERVKEYDFDEQQQP